LKETVMSSKRNSQLRRLSIIGALSLGTAWAGAADCA
jgi:hypothetical protein